MEVHVIRGVHNIDIRTTDVARSARFYQMPGFSESCRNERGVLATAGDWHLVIFATR
jgi:hypothetical protein